MDFFRFVTNGSLNVAFYLHAKQRQPVDLNLLQTCQSYRKWKKRDTCRLEHLVGSQRWFCKCNERWWFVRNLYILRGGISNRMDKLLLISSLVPFPASAVKSWFREAHFHFLAGCGPGLFCCFHVALSKGPSWPLLSGVFSIRVINFAKMTIFVCFVQCPVGAKSWLRHIPELQVLM